MITKQQVISKLKKVNDPELRIDIWTMGLIYDINIDKSIIRIKMTFTTPGCPYGPWLLDSVKNEVSKIKGVKKVDIDLTFDPLWKPSENLKEMLGI